MAQQGFIDHHAHVLRAAARPDDDWTDLDRVRALHRVLRSRGLSPVDEPEPPGTAGLAGVFDAALRGASELGIVELWEAGVPHPAYLDALRGMREAGPLPLRVRLLIAAGLAERDMPSRTGDDWLEVAGVKFYADGWLGPRTCALSHPFHDSADDAGVLFEAADHLARRVEPFAAAGWTIAVHAIGDRAIESVLDSYERVYGDDCARAAPRIEHAQVLREDLIARMGALGVVACVQPSFAFDDQHHAEAALGSEWPLAYRWTRLLEGGVRVISGSDFPIGDLDPQVGLAKLEHNPFDPIDRDTALRIMASRVEDGRTMSRGRLGR